MDILNECHYLLFWIFLIWRRHPYVCELLASLPPTEKGPPNLVFRHCNITEDALNYLMQRYNKSVIEAESPLKVSVTTGLIILLRATSRGDDSSVIQAVGDIDTFCWTPKALYSKINKILQKLKDDKERARIMRCTDPEAVRACLCRQVTCIPDPARLPACLCLTD